jgi:flagellar hook protein FlgE
MAILSALSIARSGLVATGDALGVTSNNIANVNTTGFKGSRAEFSDLLASQTGGATSGLGVRIGGASTNFSQGSIENTGRSTDMAIQGNGFFVIQNGDGRLYTRAGNFRIDADSLLTSDEGLQVMGQALDATGAPTGNLVPITFGTAATDTEATSTITLKNNLDAEAPIIAGGFVATDFDTANASSNFATTVKVFDSLGARHDVILYFTRTGAGAWDVNAAVDGGEIASGTPGTLSLLGTVSLTFDTTGALLTPPPTPPTTIGPINFDGAEPQTIALDFGPDVSAAVGDGLGREGIVQLASASNVAGAPDGFGAGALAGISVNQEGIITGIFDNGQSRELYQLALANFQAPDRLVQIGGGLYRESVDSGVAAVSSPGSGGIGNIVGQAIERSNVDLAQEFVDLISLQRSFQANARVITTSDGLLSDLISIVR